MKKSSKDKLREMLIKCEVEKNDMMADLILVLLQELK